MSQDFNYSQMVFYNMAFHENQAWFCHCYYNALCKIDLETKEISIEAFFPTGDGIFSRYGDVVYCEEKLILIPRNTTIILIYDLKNRAFTEIELSNDYINSNEIYNLFSNAILYENNVFFFPGRYRAIVKLSLKTLKLTYYAKWYQSLKPYIKERTSVMFWDNEIFKEDILLPFCQGDNVVKFSLKNGEFEIFEIGNKDLQISSIICDGDNCWLGNKNKNAIYQWNIESNELLRFDDFPDTFKSECAGVHKIVKFKNEIYIFPIFGNMVTKLNLENMKMESFFELKTDCAPQLESFQIAKNNFLKFSFYDNKLYMYSIQDGMVYCLDLKTQTIEKIESVIKNVPEDIKSKITETLFMTKDSKKIVSEKNNLKMDLFIENVTNETFLITQINKTNNVGAEIYKLLKKF